MSADGIQFNNIPGSGLTAPIFSFEVNSGGQYQQVDRFILIGHKTSSGSIALDTPTPVADQNTVDQLCGAGSMLREMFRVASANAPASPFWIIALDDTSLTAPVWTVTIGTLPGQGVATCQIAGETISVNVGAADTPTTIAAALASAINAYYNPLTKAMLPVTATSSAAVVTITSRNKGLIFNDIDFYVPISPVGNIFAAANVWTLAQTVQGSGSPTVATALAAIGDGAADYVVAPWTDTTSLASYLAFNSDVNGRWAWNNQLYGHVWACDTDNFSSLTTLGLSQNDRHTTIIGRVSPGANGSPHGRWLWAAAFAARVSPWLSDCVTGNVSRNQTGLVLQGVSPPRDASVRPNYSGRNVLNNSGISTFKVGADGSLQIDKIVTTYQLGSSGQPDTVFRDVQALYQCAGGLKYLRTVLANEHGQKALAQSNPGNLGAISTPADIQGTFIHGYAQLVANGVFSDTATFTGLLQVAINNQNPNRVDVFAPLERVNPLDILAANATIYQQFPQSLAA